MRHFSVALLLFTSLAACNENNKRSEPLLPPGATLLEDTVALDPNWSKENLLTIHATAEPDNLHPCNGSSSLRSEILQLTQLFLISNESGTNLKPDLVISLPQIEKDGKSYRYKLRNDIRWPDGSPITSDDVLFTCKVNSSGLAENPAGLSYWSRLQKAVAVDSTEFILTMDAQRTNDIAYLASFPILQRSYFDPENALAKLTLKDSAKGIVQSEVVDPAIIGWFRNFNTGGFGTDPNKIHCPGMYKVTAWEVGRYIILDRRENTVPESPQRIIYRFNRDENTTLIGLHNQLYDISPSIGGSAFKEALDDPFLQKNYRLVLSPTYNYSYICFNGRPIEAKRLPYFTDAVTRKAIASMIPINEIIRLVYGEDAAKVPRMNSYVSPLKPDFDSTLMPLSQDVQQAKRLLSKAGWQDTDMDGVPDRRTENGTLIQLEPELLYLNSSPDWKAIAEIITSALLKSGIRLKPIAVDPVTYNTRARSHDFDLLLGSWGGNALPEDPAQLWSTKSWSENGSNYSGFGTAHTDSIIDAINRSENSADRRRLSIELQRAIHDEQPYVFLYNSMRRMIIHKRWSNVIVFPDRPGYQPEQWSLRKR